MNSETKGGLFVMLAAFLWGTIGIISKIIYADTSVGPVSLAWFRLIFAIPFLGIYALLRQSPFRLERNEIPLFLAFGFFSLTVFEAMFFTAFAYTLVQHAVALLYTGPAWVALLARIILKERLTRARIIAVGLSILGAFLILGMTRLDQLFATETQIGDWLALGSGLAYSTWYIFGKLLGRNRKPEVTSFWALAFGSIFLLPVMVLLEGFHLPSGELAWSLVALVGIVPSGIAYILYLGGLKLIDATKASVLAIVEPVAGAILAFLVFQEIFTPAAAVGFLLIISSIVLIART